jgi:hypothetical protein
VASNKHDVHHKYKRYSKFHSYLSYPARNHRGCSYLSYPARNHRGVLNYHILPEITGGRGLVVQKSEKMFLITSNVLLLLLLLITLIESSPDSSIPYTSTDKTNKN